MFCRRHADGGAPHSECTSNLCFLTAALERLREPVPQQPSGSSQGFLTKVNVNSAFAGSCTNSTTHSPSGVGLVAVLTGPSGGS